MVGSLWKGGREPRKVVIRGWMLVGGEERDGVSVRGLLPTPPDGFWDGVKLLRIGTARGDGMGDGGDGVE